MSWADSFFTLDPDELETPWYCLFGGMLPVKKKGFKETEPAQRRLRGRVWCYAGGAGGDGAVAGGKLQAPGADGAGRGKADKGRFAMGKHWHSSDAVYLQLQRLIQIWCTAGTYDHLNLGGVAAVEEVATQTM